MKSNLSSLFYKINLMFRSSRLSYKIIKNDSKGKRPKVVGMLRVRNESLLIQDTLDHLSKHVDFVILFDDKSTDNTVEIAYNHKLVNKILVNRHWRKNRTIEETANRRALLREAKKYNPEWIFYCDADERFDGSIKSYLSKNNGIKGIRISLFDAYITKNDYRPYRHGIPLYEFRDYFGPERRDILMIWKNEPCVKYYLPDSREPTGVNESQIRTKFFCQHYGKSLSVKHWEETCDYYINNFPQYADKWRNRKGKAIHDVSDFGRPLLKWKDVKIKTKSVKIN